MAILPQWQWLGWPSFVFRCCCMQYVLKTGFSIYLMPGIIILLLAVVYTGGASPRRADAGLGSAHAAITEDVGKSRPQMRHKRYWQGVHQKQIALWVKRKKTLGSDSMNQQQIWPSGTQWRTAAGGSGTDAAATTASSIRSNTQSSSSSSSSGSNTLYALGLGPFCWHCL